MFIQGSSNSIYSQWQASKLPTETLLDLSNPLINEEDPIKSKFPFTTKELTILNLSVNKLLSKIKEGSLTCLETTEAYVKSASFAHQLTNCLTEVLFQDAIQQAKALDQYYKDNNGQTIGPLHGLPLSVKDEFDIKGVRTTLGLVSRTAKEPATKTSPNIEILVKKGAIILSKTAVPIGAFNRKTFNNSFGITSSPYGKDLNPGGSTGGEASLISMKGSALGVGSDLGGSIRQPCALSGLFGLRPTSLRVPHMNSSSVVHGLESLRGVNGPIGRDVDSLRLYMKTILDEEPWRLNSNVVPLPWKEDENRVKLDDTLNIAIMRSDGLIDPTPPIKRAIDEVVFALKSTGVNIIEIPTEIKEILQNLGKLSGQFMTSSGNKKLVSEIEESGEDVPYLSFLKRCKDVSTSELWSKHIERDLNISKFQKWWFDNHISTMLAPVTAQAYLFQKSDLCDNTYGPFVNVLDVPSVTFPVTKLQRLDYESAVGSSNNRNIHLSKESEFVLNEFLQTSEKDKKRFIGNIPINLQIVGSRFCEEYLLEILDALLEII